MAKKAVVIGAGQSGRGYTARYLFEKGYEITFIDEKKELVDLLNEDRAFCIHFYHMDRTPLYIHGFHACMAYSAEADRAIAEADFVFTAVGEQNLGDVAKQLKQGMKGKAKRTVVITCENGVNPGRVMREHMQAEKIEAPYVVSQTAIFCSTVVIRGTRLDILSQNETYFPYDCDEFTDELDFDGAVPIHDFEKFFKRKIYTYNCLAGLISYCGYIKGFEVYGEAAVDPDISELMDRLLAELNPCLEDYFGISKEEQAAFAQKALDKFKDQYILDYNVKNGRAPKRKLGPTERIMTPMHILIDHHKDPRIMQFVAAAALVYWNELQGKNGEPVLEKPLMETFCEINSLSLEDPIAQGVEKYLKEIQKNRKDVHIIDILYGSGR